MQNYGDIRIAAFLSFAYPIILDQIRVVLKESGLDFRESGHGLDHSIWIKNGEKEVRFFLHNLLLEIATIDRDEQPLRFDTNLSDLDYIAAKSARLVASKLRVLSSLLEHDDIEKAIDSIAKESGSFERIRIWRVDQEKSKKES